MCLSLPEEADGEAEMAEGRTDWPGAATGADIPFQYSRQTRS